MAIRILQSLILVSALLACLGGCKEEPLPETTPTQSLTDPFPDGFLWGTATAGFQVDMGCPSDPCPDLYGDWYQWVTTTDIVEEDIPGTDATLANGDAVEDGPGHWELYETDFDLAANELHNNGYRMGIEFSRLFTQPTDNLTTFEELKAAADPDAVQHYHDVFDAQIARGITPLVTLNHYNFPTWLHDGVACHFDIEECENRGWLDRKRVTTELAKFSGFVAREYGDAVDLWATINEPYAVILAGYAFVTESRTNPPAISDLGFSWGVEVIKAMIEAHAAMYDAVHANDTVDADGDGDAAMVGLVPNLAAVKPANPDRAIDVEAVPDANYLYNLLFLNALVRGEWDENFDGTYDEIREDLKGRMDYVGINYYTRLKIVGVGAPLSTNVPSFTFAPDTTLLFDYYPKGIYEVCMLVKEEYDLPVYITENGTADTFEHRDGDFLIPHLAWLRKAIHDGADVRGYFLWSLMDNYEWNHGYSLKFGAYSYDIDTKERKARPIVDVYGTIAKANALTQAQLDQFGGDNLPTTATTATP